MNKLTIALIVSLLLSGTQAHAQNTKTPAALERVVASGEDVTIEIDGERTPLRGRLLSVADDVVAFDMGGTIRSVEFGRVARVDRHGDSVVDGALIGAVVLGGMCRWTCLEMKLRSQANYVAGVIGATVMGGMMGAAIDRKHVGTTTIYRRGRRTSVGIMMSPGSVGIAAQFGGW